MPRCYAANAIHAASVLQLTCGRATGSHTGRVRRSTTNATSWFGRIRTPRCRQLQQSYTTTVESAIKDRTVTSAPNATSEEEHRRAQRLALYEEVLIKDEPTHLNEEQKRQQRREAIRNTHVQEESPVDWKTHSLALSEQIRKARKARPDPAPEDGEWSPPAPQISLDYTGLAIDPLTSKADPPMPIPWAQSYDVREKEITASQILDLEIAAFANHMEPTPAEKKARLSVLKLTTKIMKTIPGHQLHNFGSYKTGLTMPYSDIDIGIFDSTSGQGARQPAMDRLYHLLDNGGEYFCVVYRPGRHSIITAQHKETGIDVQIVARGKSFQDSRVQDYLQAIPHLQQLYSVVRTAFGVRGFVDPFIGGISAYGTFMMLVSALTRRGTPSTIHESPSSQLLHFLSFWANFDTTKYGISPNFPRSTSDSSDSVVRRPAKLFQKIAPDDFLTPQKSKAQLASLVQSAKARGNNMRAGQYRIGRSRPEQPYLLCLQDPANPINDLGATCYAIKHILQTIKVLHRDLVRLMELHDRSPPGDRPKSEMSLLLPLVGRSHELYAERRQRLHESVVPLRYHDVGVNRQMKKKTFRNVGTERKMF